MSNERKLSRREFAREAALAVTVAATIPTELLAQSQKPTPPAKPPEASPPQTELPPAAKAEAQQYYQAVLQKYGSRLTEEEKKDVARLLELQQKSIEAVRAFALDNGDEPASVLQPFQSEETTHATR